MVPFDSVGCDTTGSTETTLATLPGSVSDCSSEGMETLDSSTPLPEECRGDVIR